MFCCESHLDLGLAARLLGTFVFLRTRALAMGGRWWSTLDVEDPITLEPISSLSHPPFELRASADASTAASDWFDSRMLALCKNTCTMTLDDFERTMPKIAFLRINLPHVHSFDLTRAWR